MLAEAKEATNLAEGPDLKRNWVAVPDYAMVGASGGEFRERGRRGHEVLVSICQNRAIWCRFSTHQRTNEAKSRGLPVIGRTSTLYDGVQRLSCCVDHG